MKTALNVLFKKMQKDDKKEVLVFQVNGDELQHAQTLVELAGGIVVMDIEGCDAGEVMAEFASLQRDSKKTALKFNIKGDSEEKVIKFYPLAGRNVTLNLQASQMSIDDYYEGEDHEGLEYNVNPDGTVSVDPDQVTLEEAGAASEEETATTGTGTYNEVSQKIKGDDKVTPISSKRGKKKDEGAEEAPAPADADDDALPF